MGEPPATAAPDDQTPASTEAARTRPRKRFRWRRIIRAMHRDIGYFCVGLTVIYAASGIAVNHIDDWDPNFTHFERVVQAGGPLTGDDAAVSAQILDQLAIGETPVDIYRAGEELTITLPKGRQVHADLTSGKIIDEGQRSRFLLRTANWLHLNRGKDSWKYIADIYAGFLLLLAFSGMFMLGGRKGLIGRGGVLVLAGVAVPVVYVALSGGPAG